MQRDLAGQYRDNYYGGKGGYDARYHGTVPTRVREAVIDAIITSVNDTGLKKGDTCVVWDDGAGTGRYFGVFQQAARRLSLRGIHLKILAVDPIKEGLEEYQAKVEESGFTNQGGGEHLHDIPENGEGYKSHIWTKGNLSVQFVHSDINDYHKHQNLEKTKRLIGDVHTSTSLFGVLSCHLTKAERLAKMRLHKDLTAEGGKILFTVAGPTTMVNQRKAYDYIGHRGSQGIVNPVPESERGEGFVVNKPVPQEMLDEGNNSYSRFRARGVGDEGLDKVVRRIPTVINMPYHVFPTKEEFAQELFDAEINNGGVQVATIGDETLLTGHPYIDALDSFVSKNMPEFLKNYTAKYFLVEGEGRGVVPNQQSLVLDHKGGKATTSEFRRIF